MLSDLARDEHKAAGRDPSRFELSVFAGLAPAWLRADSENRAALERMGVARLILLTGPPYDPSQIRAKRRRLTRHLVGNLAGDDNLCLDLPSWQTRLLQERRC